MRRLGILSHGAAVRDAEPSAIHARRGYQLNIALSRHLERHPEGDKSYNKLNGNPHAFDLFQLLHRYHFLKEWIDVRAVRTSILEPWSVGSDAQPVRVWEASTGLRAMLRRPLSPRSSEE